ncbi:MAG: cation diffusion facilitator family transporter [Rhodospirillales bacterium]|nr:cation diffusion facilitator family transporter [Rhodospirillales bacterium]
MAQGMATARHDATIEAAANGRLMKRATYASVAAAAMLIVVKIGAWVATDSVSVLSSLLDSLLDAAASLVNLLAVRHALTPADREHRFGHGKAEPLAGLAQSAFIAGSALLLFSEAVRRLAAGQPVVRSEIGIAVMVLSIVVTVLLVAYQRHVVRRTGSVAIRADSLHYGGDILLNGGVIVSLLASVHLGWTVIDPLFGLAIGGYILFSAYRIARLSLDLLMDRELPDADRARIREIARRHVEVRDLHDMRTRSAGPGIFIQFHLEMDGGLSLRRAHEIADEVEAEILAVFPNAEVIIHQDPEGVAESRKTFAVR